MKITPRLRQGGKGIVGGLHSGADWTSSDGRAVGYEGLLGEKFHFLLAAITGYLATKLTLDGPRTDPKAIKMCSDRLTSLEPTFGPYPQTNTRNSL